MECDAAHAQEKEVRKQAIKTSNNEDPTVRLLKTTCQAARVQANQTLKEHFPVLAQGPLIVNALSTAMQFKMSI